MNSQTRPPRLWGLWCVFIALLVVYAGHARSTRKDSRREILEFSNSVKLGSNQDEIRKAFQEHNYKTLKLVQSSPDLWVVTTPFELFGANWVMRIRFVNDRVSGTHFSTEQDTSRHPEGAPPDL
jgi:serine protease inhibitor